MSHAATTRSHPFHIIDPSPWPALGSFGALVMAWGGVDYMHGGPPLVLLCGLGVVLLTMMLWWRDVIRESRIDRAHTPPVITGLQMGMALFIGSEVMFFVAFFWAYFHNALHFSPVTGGVWPPEGIETAHAFGLPLANTIILVTSGLTLMWGKGGIENRQRWRLATGLALSIGLGVLFLSLQAWEYGLLTYDFRGGIFPSTFYMATGFHGFHVFVGVCMLSVMLVRTLLGHFDGPKHLGFQFAEWYWHFVDVVWVFLFVFLYWWVGA